MRWAKIPQLPPSSKQLLAKKSGVTFRAASFLLLHSQKPAQRGLLVLPIFRTETVWAPEDQLGSAAINHSAGITRGTFIALLVPRLSEHCSWLNGTRIGGAPDKEEPYDSGQV